MSNCGLDIGTNMLVAARVGEDGSPEFKMQRDAFYTIEPKSEVNKHSIQIALDKQNCKYIMDGHNFLVVGEDALQTAIERNDVAKRPLRKGVVSPKEKASLPMLKYLIKELIGDGSTGDKIVYSVPAKPIDASYDIIYHTEMMNVYLNDMGYDASPLNEGYAIALNELLDDGLSGVAISWGAGMVNIAVLHQGDALVEFSTTKSGDFIDLSVGNALDLSPSLVQLEKEAGIDLSNLISSKDSMSTSQEELSVKIKEAVSVYYSSVFNYTLQNIAYQLEKSKKELPLFREPIPVIVSGGLSLAKGFVKRFETALSGIELPFKVSEIRKAENPMCAVASGCLLAAQL